MGIDVNQGQMADSLSALIVFLILGLALLWLLSQVGETVFQKFKPIMMFLIIAAALGWVVMGMLNKMF